jgi:hypothetical protein
MSTTAAAERRVAERKKAQEQRPGLQDRFNEAGLPRL